MTNEPNPNDAQNAPTRSYRSSSNFATGLILIAVGALFFIDRQGWVWGLNLSFSRLWPVLLIVMGLAQMLSAANDDRVDDTGRVERIRRGRWTGGTWWLFVGVIMLLHQNHWLVLTQSWPLFIIAGGISMLFGRDGGRRREK